MNALLRFIALIATPAALITFLLASGFFRGWSGHAVSFRPVDVENPATFDVLVVEAPGETTVVSWKADLVRELGLRADALMLEPTELPSTAVATTKPSFALAFTIDDGETTRKLSTTSAGTLSIALLTWILLIVLRNMYISGSPWGLEAPEPKNESIRPTSSSASSGAPRRRRSQKGPPPPKRRKGSGRRR